jgi:hypothetical protein
MAIEVYDKVTGFCDSIEHDHLGEDLAYLMGAILKENKVEWDKRYNGAPRPLVTVLLTELGAEHPVWQFIDLV